MEKKEKNEDKSEPKDNVIISKIKENINPNLKEVNGGETIVEEEIKIKEEIEIPNNLEENKLTEEIRKKNIIESQNSIDKVKKGPCQKCECYLF